MNSNTRTDAIATVVAATLALLAAGTALDTAIVGWDTAYCDSATATATAIDNGVTLAVLAKANKDAATAAGIGDDAAKSYLYGSTARVAIHGFVGNILALHDDGPIMTMDVHALVGQCYQPNKAWSDAAKALVGSAVIRRAIKSADTRTEAVKSLRSALAAAKALAKSDKDAAKDAADDAAADDTAESQLAATATVADMLRGVLAAIANGATIDDDARGRFLELSANFRPAAIVTAA